MDKNTHECFLKLINIRIKLLKVNNLKHKSFYKNLSKMKH